MAGGLKQGMIEQVREGIGEGLKYGNRWITLIVIEVHSRGSARG